MSTKSGRQLGSYWNVEGLPTRRETIDRELQDAMSKLFLQLIGRGSTDGNFPADVLIDTNVALETLSVGDLLREGDALGTAAAAWQARSYRYRIVRARHSLLLLWVMAKRGIAAGMLGNEVVDMLEKLAPTPAPRKGSLVGAADGTSYALAVGFVRVIRPVLIARGLKLGALTEVNHVARGAHADNELLKLAARDRLPIITNEGLTETGLVEVRANGKPNLRGLCRQSSVAVFTPAEYLAHLRVTLAKEAEEFIAACELPVIREYLARPFDDVAYRSMLEDLIPLLRLILLGEARADIEALAPRP